MEAQAEPVFQAYATLHKTVTMPHNGKTNPKQESAFRTFPDAGTAKLYNFTIVSTGKERPVIVDLDNGKTFPASYHVSEGRKNDHQEPLT